VALRYYFDHVDYQAIEHALIEGYRAERPLSDSDLALLPLFLLVRKLVSLGWLRQRPELGPDKRLPAMIEETCARAEVFLNS
jgi:Ser/Thr protein kinase RdoA (MazF antagonist)